MADLHFDVGIIGSGSVGLSAAYKLAAAGKKVMIIEKYLWGGTCPNYGCDPKKILLTAVEALERSKKLSKYGVLGELKIDWVALQANRKGYTDAVEPRKLKSLEKAGVEYIHGIASFTDTHTVEVRRIREGLATTISADDWIVAVGQKPKELEFPGHEFTLTPEQFLKIDNLADEVLFIGAGYVGMEFATIATGAGSKSHIV
ncbi:MAG: FAD-dependent oxidoreductase, partial [Lactobacillaceae bacterium]|nr:FAD-dependent oxidoreductase [Lactobacillaceae bacterium]